MNKRLHESGTYGVHGFRSAPLVQEIAEQLGITEVLDFGCGNGSLGEKLREQGYTVYDYDPAIEGKDGPATPTELVYCGDVAEHVEPEYLDNFLDELVRVTKKALIIVIATSPANKTLEDGRNAHLIVEPTSWWLPKLEARFDIELFKDVENYFIFVGWAK